MSTTILDRSASEEIVADFPEFASALGAGIFAEHEPVFFPSYPYEWPAEMLHAAGQLTLDLAKETLPEGMGLKDATPYNVLFRGAEPVFVDLLSFERRDPGDSRWLPYAQFVRTFLLPLLASKHFGMPVHQLMMHRRDGLEPEEVYRWTSALRRIMPPFLTLSTIPTWLSPKPGADTRIYRKHSPCDPEKARFVLEALFGGLRRTLSRLAPSGTQQSRWTGYLERNNNYSQEQLREKETFLRRAFQETIPRSVLDIGCNTGHFSAIAARSGARVIAIDSDPVVVGQTWRMARDQSLDILPLVVDVSRPSPGIGWRNRECASFLERAAGKFDTVLMLALVHHLLVTERIPLREIVALAAELTTDTLIVEWVPPEDSMFRRICRGRDDLFRDLNQQSFETECRERFEIVRRDRVADSLRWLYQLRKTKIK